MSNRSINRLLISIICFLLCAICVLIFLIATRPQQVTTEGNSFASFTKLPATETLTLGNTSSGKTDSITEPSTVAPTEEEKRTLYARTTSLLNIRASNSTDAVVLKTVSENTILQVLDIQSDGWTKILYEGQEAYVSSAYIILIQE